MQVQQWYRSLWTSETFEEGFLIRIRITCNSGGGGGGEGGAFWFLFCFLFLSRFYFTVGYVYNSYFADLTSIIMDLTFTKCSETAGIH